MPKLTVPQQDGQIVINRAGTGGVTYDVQGGQVDVALEDVLSFLRDIPGSFVTGEAPAAAVSTAPKGNPPMTPSSPVE